MQHSLRVAVVAAVALFAAGCNGGGQGGEDSPSVTGPWTAVAVGAVHTVALRADGTLWAFGGNDHGQVGDGTSSDRLEPVQVGTALRWSAAAAGAYHTVALTADGALYAWGRNAEGQLGDGTTSPRFEPAALATTARFTAVAAGGVHTLAIRDDGTLVAWGSNGKGQLGVQRAATPVLEPQPVPTTATWRSVCAGAAHSLAIRTDGTLWAWGRNTEDQLGAGGNQLQQFEPAQVGTATTWTAISAGTAHTVGLRDGGTLWWWGYDTAEPAAVPTTARFVAAVAGEYATLAVRDDGTAWGWGNPGDGRLGAGSSFAGSGPYRVADPGPFVALAAGRHAAAVKRGGTLWTWGSGSRGQLGLGTSGFSENRTVPSSLGRSFADVAARSYGAAAIALDGTLWSWGANASREIGLRGAPDSVPAPVQVSADTTWTALAGGAIHTVGLRGGALAGFGDDSLGQLGRGPLLWLEPAALATTAPFTQIAAGWFHTVALRDDGTLWMWGQSYGRAGGPDPFLVPTTAVWSAVAAGGKNSFAIRSDGTLWAWGDNYFGSLGDGTYSPRSAPVQVGTWSDWAAVSAGSLSTFGIRSDGSLWAWGLTPGATTGVEPWSMGPLAYRADPARVGLDTGWTEVSAGDSHVLGRRGGELYAWGDSSYGQLGDGARVSRTAPTRIAAGTTWTRVVAAQRSSYALADGGELFVWGSNYDGQLGIGTAGKSHDRWVPTPVP